jgi:hypothetical protein
MMLFALFSRTWRPVRVASAVLVDRLRRAGMNSYRTAFL